MKARTILIYRGEYHFRAHPEEMTQTDIDTLVMRYANWINKMDHLEFYGDDSIWYCFPRKVLDECILCVEVMEEEE